MTQKSCMTYQSGSRTGRPNQARIQGEVTGVVGLPPPQKSLHKNLGVYILLKS